MARWFSLPCFFLLVSVAIAAAPIDVIIVAGQSNAVGFDAAPSDLPDDPRDAKVLFWYRCGDPPPDDHDSRSDGWTTLGSQPLGDPIQPRRDRQYGNFGQPSGGFGPEIGLARKLVANENRSLAIIKVAFSGTHVAGDWNPNLEADTAPASEQDSRGACYRSLVAEVGRALAALAEKYQPKLVAIVWVQGESDATAERAEKYQPNIAAMIAALRKDLDAPDLIALLAVNTAFGGGKNQYLQNVVGAQKAYAESDPRARYVDTAGASVANPVHFDAAGTIDVGERMAKSLVGVLSGQ